MHIYRRTLLGWLAAQAWQTKLSALLQMQQVQSEENLVTQTVKNEGYEINAATTKREEEDRGQITNLELQHP